MTNKLHICTYVTSIWKSVRTLFSKSGHTCLFSLAFVWNIKCPAAIEPVYILESYSAHSISIQLHYLQPSLLVIPSSKVRRGKNVHIGSLLSKRKRKTKHWEHLDSREAITEASHCFLPRGYTVVIDQLTRAEWFLSPRGAKHSLCALLYSREKKRKIEKDTQCLRWLSFCNTFDLNTML